MTLASRFRCSTMLQRRSRDAFELRLRTSTVPLLIFVHCRSSHWLKVWLSSSIRERSTLRGNKHPTSGQLKVDFLLSLPLSMTLQSVARRRREQWRWWSTYTLSSTEHLFRWVICEFLEVKIGVDEKRSICHCMYYEENGMPCTHSKKALLLHLGQNGVATGITTDWYHDCYHVSTYTACYMLWCSDSRFVHCWKAQGR
jgi:hypothetical protein